MTDTTSRTPLILDVDTGIDDSLALLYAAGSPDAEIVAADGAAGKHLVRRCFPPSRPTIEIGHRHMKKINTHLEMCQGRRASSGAIRLPAWNAYRLRSGVRARLRPLGIRTRPAAARR